MIINPYFFEQPLLLDLYPNAAVAYSVRKLRTAYSGAALRVRRSSDNAESDIGFVSNQLDTASLLSFVGANDGFVTTWYDQSLNNRNATNGTAAQQPRIVNAGVLEVSSVNKPAIRIIDTSGAAFGHNLSFANWFTASQSYVGAFSVYQMNTGTTNNAGILNSNPYARGFSIIYQNTRAFSNGTARVGGNSGGTGVILNNNQLYLRYDFANRVNLQTYVNGLNTPYVNVSDNNSDFVMPTNFVIGTNLAVTTQNTSISEFIAYTTDQTSNKTGIETNINSYYSVWASGPTWDGSQSGMLNTYSGAAVAYSVRALNSAYTGPLIRVRRSSDNTEIDIFALYNGELDTTFLLNFVGAGNGFVTTWYDQSTNGRNQTQTTAINQPRIVNNGILDIKGSKPCLNFDGTNDFLFNMTGILNNVGISAFTVLSLNSLTQRRAAWDLGFPTSYNYFVLEANTNLSVGQRFGFYMSNSTIDSNFQTNLNQNLISIFSNTTIGTNVINNMNYYTNSILRTLTLRSGSGNFTNYSTANSITIGSFYLGAGQLFNGQLQEVIFYSSNIISNRVGMETNINSYFNIYP